MEFTENVKKEYYPAPTQVIFEERNESEFLGMAHGVAYQNKIICLHCGYPIDLNDDDVFIWKEFSPWMSVTEFLEEKIN
jgi:hypothetical protein